MAPNLKNFSLLSESLAGIKLIHPKLAPAPVQRAPVDSPSYWDWEAPACDDGDLPTVNVLSTVHMEANLRAAAAVQSECGVIVQSNPEFDSYWTMDVDEHDDASSEQDEEPSADDYWNYAAAHVQSEAEDYWNMPTADVTRPAVKNSSYYWNEPTHAKTSSDAYWNIPSASHHHMADKEEQNESSPYWQWSQHVKTSSDAYWS